MVLALAIIHHLVLGLGMTVDDVIDSLTRFVKKRLILEFVAKEDPLILGTPTFFPAYGDEPAKYDSYNLGYVLQALAKRFPTVEQLSTNQSSRTIIVCSY